MEASISAIASDVNAKSAGVEASSSSVLRWMSHRNDNWLMVFDGADVGYEIVEAFIPAGQHGNILISSRNVTMDRLASPSSAYMEIVGLDEDAAVELFIKSAKLDSLSPADLGHVEAIAQELCYLALAVDQAASSIATGICRIDEYLDVYQRHRLRLMDGDLFKGCSNYGRAVYTTWDVSFAELERRASSLSSDSASYEAAILILRLFSFFHFDGIHEEIFRRAAEATGKYLSPLQSDSPLLRLLQQTEKSEWDSFNFRAGICVLSQFSLIKVDGKSTGTYSMHGLVHQWTQDRLPKSSCSKIASLAAIVLARSGGFGDSAEDHTHRRGLLVHLTTLSVHLKQLGLMKKLSVDTRARMVRICRDGGNLVEAVVLLQQGISILQKENLEGTVQCINFMAELASIVRKLGRIREAESLGQQVLEWRKNHLGTNDESTVSARHHLALTLYRLGKFGQAKELMTQVLDWRKEHLGTDHPDIYLAMSTLAMTLYGLGELREAKQLNIQVLDWQKEHCGMNHPNTYRAMVNLAVTLIQLGELEEAKQLNVQVLNWQKEHCGMDHPDTYRAMGNLAYTLYELDELAEAKKLQVQVLDWRKLYLGPENPKTIRAMDKLALTLQKLGEVSEAEELFAQVKALQAH
jgi:tetratricopeptide (TPR) repeat protein